jgi:hypothetical protein
MRRRRCAGPTGAPEPRVPQAPKCGGAAGDVNVLHPCRRTPFSGDWYFVLIHRPAGKRKSGASRRRVLRAVGGEM